MTTVPQPDRSEHPAPGAHAAFPPVLPPAGADGDAAPGTDDDAATDARGDATPDARGDATTADGAASPGAHDDVTPRAHGGGAVADRDRVAGTLVPAADPDRADDPALSTHDRLLLALLGTRTLLLDATRRARLTGWLGALAVTALAGVLRFWDLGRPHALVFDETYYVKQAYSLLVQGYEGTWADGANAAFESGDGSALRASAEYVVHPPVGKWLIALGIRLGGGIESAAAWRLADRKSVV